MNGLFWQAMINALLFILLPFILSLFRGLQINKLKLKFEEITDNYVKEPQCRSQDFGFVFAGWLSKHNGVC